MGSSGTFKSDINSKTTIVVLGDTTRWNLKEGWDKSKKKLDIEIQRARGAANRSKFASSAPKETREFHVLSFKDFVNRLGFDTAVRETLMISKFHVDKAYPKYVPPGSGRTQSILTNAASEMHAIAREDSLKRSLLEMIQANKK